MTDDEFKIWKGKHAVLFRWGDNDLGMADMWRSVFEARNFTGDELLRGSIQLAEKEPKKWRAEHLEFLLAFVSSERLLGRIAAQRAEDAKHVNDACNVCFGSGKVIVPHPVQGDALVTCYCYRGQRFKEERERIINEWTVEKKKRDERPPLNVTTLFDYERQYPNWRELVESRAARRRTERQVREQTAVRDRRDGPLDMRRDFKVNKRKDDVT